MKIWLACQAKNLGNGKLIAFPFSINDSSEVRSQLDSIQGLTVAHLCPSKKRAVEICAAWNKGFERDG